MKEFRRYTPVSDALAALRSNVFIVTRDQRIRTSLAFGRTISRDVVASSDIPASDSSHMDGYAVSAKDLQGASTATPVKLRAKKGLAVGESPQDALDSGEAYSILTGGLLPRGADTVVPVEHTRLENGRVVVTATLRRGSNVYKVGSDVRRGETVMRKGAVLRAQDVGLLASLHVASVWVFKRPVVGIVATGSELSSRIVSPPAGKVTETHSLVMSRLVEAAGGTARSLGVARDEKSAIAAKLRRALAGCDIVLTIAGTSRGGADITAAAINSLGKPGMLVHGVKIYRGRVMGVAAVRGKPIVLLPGPIQGAVNAFLIFVYPLMRQFLGADYGEPMFVRATLASDWRAKERFEDFTKIVYLRLTLSEGRFRANPVEGETEKMTVLTQSNAYAVIGEDVSLLQSGDSIDAHLLPGFSYVDGRFLD